MSNTMYSRAPEKFSPHTSGLDLGDIKILMQKKKTITFKTVSFMWIWFANMYDNLHSKRNL